MNISSGVSEINYTTGLGKTGKVYIWPNYNAGRIEPVRPLIAEKHDQYIYKKADEKTEKDLMMQANEMHSATYDYRGRIHRNAGSAAAPGSLFTALA